jgi:phage tail sheath protein FI
VIRALLCVLIATSLIVMPLAAAAMTPIAGKPDSDAGFVGLAVQGPFDLPVAVQSAAEFKAEFGGFDGSLSNPYLAPSVRAFFANGGKRAWIVRVSSDSATTLIGADGATPGSRTGLQALIPIDAIRSVSIPGVSDQAVQLAMIDFCNRRGDCMALLDPLSRDDSDAALAQRSGVASAHGYAAMYFPWVRFLDQGIEREIPPSGFVAGRFAATEPRESPVGVLASVAGLSYDVTTADQDILNPAGVNVLRDFGSNGIRVFGARTIASDPEWVFIAVRRQASHLRESILYGTRWAYPVDNEPPLWAELEQAIDDWMLSLWQSGWFNGAQPQDAWFARVDSSTTTPGDIVLGRTNMLVGFAALLPAEFIVLPLTIDRLADDAWLLVDGFE